MLQSPHHVSKEKYACQYSSRGQLPATSQRSLWAELTQNRIVALVLAMIVAVPLLAAPADLKLDGYRGPDS